MESVVKSEYDAIDIKEEFPSTDYPYEFTETKHVAEPTSEPTAVDQFQTLLVECITKQLSDDHNIYALRDTFQRPEKLLSCRENSEATSEEISKKQLKHSEEQCQIGWPPGLNLGFPECESKTFPVKNHHSTVQNTCTRQNSFTCNLCAKAISWRKLKKHTFSHAEEKPYSCVVCTKSFPYRSFLEIHILTHTGEKFFSCDLCPKTFTYKGALKQHMRTHSDEKIFSCDICNKAFSHRCNLVRHQLTHTGNKPFSCDFCSLAFSQKTSLNRHVLTHTGERPFSCEFCPKAFALKSNLKRHQIIHTEVTSLPLKELLKRRPAKTDNGI